MRVPRTNRALPWFQQKGWQTFADSLFRFYSRRSSYSLIFAQMGAAGAVDQRHQLVYLDPQLLPVHAGAAIRHRTAEALDTRALLMRAILAHEAGHVQFSGEKPAGLLGQLWNALEDERMERLMAQRYPELRAAFEFLGDVLAAAEENHWQGGSLEGCLAMRWDHDRAQPTWRSRDPDTWADVWPLVQAAWRAPDSEQVVWIARCILGLLGEPEDAPNDPYGGQAQATGAGHAPPAEGGEAGGQAGAGGNAAGATPPQRPDPPAEPPVLSPVEAAARTLAGVLRVRAQPSRKVSHESRGQLDFGRYHSGQRRVFRHKTEPARPRPLHLTWVVDRSGSMQEQGRMASAVTALRMALRAAQLASVPTRVLAFDDQVDEEVAWHTPFEQAERQVRALYPRGTTTLAPALKLAFEGVRGRGDAALHLIVVISDGGLDDDDLAACRRLLQRAPAQVLPVLIGEATDHVVLARWQSVFQPVLVAANHQQLAGLIHSRLSTFRRRFS